MGQRVVRISSAFLQKLMSENGECHFRCTAGLPDDAQFVSYVLPFSDSAIWRDDVIGMIFESSAWESVKGEVDGDFMPVFESIHS
jgi:hypothetical protein